MEAHWNDRTVNRTNDGNATERERARTREIYERAAHDDPNNPDVWLRLAYVAPDPRTALESIERAVDLNPDNPRVQAGLRYILFSRLKDDPFVEFLAETDKNYVVTLRNSRPVVIPKARAEEEVYPPPRLTEVQRAAGLVGWMALGIVPAGLGAFVLAPVAISRAFKLLRARGLSAREQRTALVTLILACGIGLIGEVLFGLLLLHWFG